MIWVLGDPSRVVVWQEMEAVIRQRFGAHGLRVFRLLLLHPQLEQKQIAEKAMLPPKVTLYSMSCISSTFHHNQGFIHVMCVISPKSQKRVQETVYTASLRILPMLKHIDAVMLWWWLVRGELVLAMCTPASGTCPAFS